MEATLTRQVTLRLPDTLYQSVKQLAQERRASINQLAQESLEKLAQEHLAAQMRAAYDALGADAESDVEPFFAAQSEAVGGE
jgi:hypothetical protein